MIWIYDCAWTLPLCQFRIETESVVRHKQCCNVHVSLPLIECNYSGVMLVWAHQYHRPLCWCMSLWVMNPCLYPWFPGPRMRSKYQSENTPQQPPNDSVFAIQSLALASQYIFFSIVLEGCCTGTGIVKIGSQHYSVMYTLHCNISMNKVTTSYLLYLLCHINITF